MSNLSLDQPWNIHKNPNICKHDHHVSSKRTHQQIIQNILRLFEQGCLNHIFLEHSILANVILQHDQIEAFVKALGDIIETISKAGELV